MIPPVPTTAVISDHLRCYYKFTTEKTNRFISIYEISDDLLNQYGYRFYPAEIRNIMRSIGYEFAVHDNGVKGYYLNP